MSVWDKLEKLCDRHLDDRLIERVIAEQEKTNDLLGQLVAAIPPAPAPAPIAIGSLILGKPVPQ